MEINIKGYKIIKRIGKGGFGAVYLVEKENKYYALKKITDLTKEEIHNYQTLLNSLFKIKCKYIIKYYESYIENDCLYIIMEYGGDTDLKKYIERQDNCFIDEKIISDIIIQICLGLKEIHRNKLIHRDLTPDNIFMNENNEIKIGDFNVSKILSTSKNYAQTQIGKVHYFAPEIAKRKKYNNKVDIYALGCIIYELFTLNEYFNDTKYDKKDGKINIKKYNPKWQNLIDSALKEDFNERADIEAILNYIQNNINEENKEIYNNNNFNETNHYFKNSNQFNNNFININQNNSKDTNNKNIIFNINNNQNQEQKNNSSSINQNNGKPLQNGVAQFQPEKNLYKPYIFSEKGLSFLDQPPYMNAILQLLLHVNELSIYFLDEYPNDQKYLLAANNKVPSKGNISKEFFNLVIGVNKNLNSRGDSFIEKYVKKPINYFLSFLDINDSFSPKDIKKTLEIYYPQFQNFDEHKIKNLVLYLLKTMHEELNYYGNQNKKLNYIPNQNNIYESYNHFVCNYNSNNFSKISLLFYGTFINTTTCLECKKKFYNLQKFEIISFETFNYKGMKFNILDGFRDNSNPIMLKGDNKFLCNYCNKLQEAEKTCKIFEPSQKLLINIDYEKKEKYHPSVVEFDEEIDITNFVDFDYKKKIKYKIIGVCTCFEHHQWLAFCRNKKNDKWYKFNDSSFSECDKGEIYKGIPYLLLYERIINN